MSEGKNKFYAIATTMPIPMTIRCRDAMLMSRYQCQDF